MHLKGFTIDLDAPAGIAAELVQILTAFAERAVETCEVAEQKDEEMEDMEREHGIQKEGLVDTIHELEQKVKSMSVVSEAEKAKHRKALTSIMEDLTAMDIG